MNQHLQNILNLIQQDESLTADQKKAIAQSLKDADKELQITAFKLDRTEKVKRTTAILLQETIEELELKQKAVEIQNRELEIEASLEKVRTAAMGMNKPDELIDVCQAMYGELLHLGFAHLRNALIHTFHDHEGYFIDHDYADLTGRVITKIFYDNHFIERSFLKNIRKSDHAFSQQTIEGNELKAWKKFRKESGQTDDPRIEKNTSLYYYVYSIGEASIGISTFEAISEEQKQILSRFRNVFDLAYKRYQDVAAALAQAREAQIEAALERIRSRTIGMQRSAELQDAAFLLFQQIQGLGAKYFGCGFNIWDEDKEEATAWMAREQGFQPPFKTSSSEDVFFHIREAAQKGETLFVVEQGGQVLETHYKYMASIPVFKSIIDKMAEAGLSVPSFQIIHCAFFSQGYLMFISFEPVPEAHDIFKRFAKVFEQTYTRFLDLQKAEVQSREAQIELGLERVRARAMAMQSSEELNALIATVFKELTRLDIALTRCTIMIYDAQTHASRWWMANSEAPDTPLNFLVKYHEHAPNLALFNAWKEQTRKFQYILQGHDKIEWDNFLFSETELSLLPDFIIDGMRAPERVYLNSSFNHFGSLNLVSLEALSNEHFDILLRFAKVFDLTYTRFNDLQKAEAQAREAKIETALEKVRSRSLAMHHSDELRQIVAVIFEQLQYLNFTDGALGIVIMNESSGDMDWWIAGFGKEDYPEKYHMPFFNHPFYLAQLDAWKQGIPFVELQVEGEAKKKYDDIVFNQTDFANIQDGAKQIMSSFEKITFSNANMKHGALSWGTEPISEAAANTLQRFAKVFDQAYTRFLDLKKAESQTREAQTEAALEKVRSRTMAMHHSDELAETAHVLFEQFRILGENPERMAIGIVNEEEQVIEIWATQHGGTLLNTMYKFTIDEPHVMKKLYEGWKKQESIILDLKGIELEEYFLFLKNAGALVDRIAFGDRRVQMAAFFSKGLLMTISPDPRPDGTINLLERFAEGFNLTYTRFLDLQKAEAQAREAKIEAALEKIRSRSLAMHHSNELKEVMTVMFNKLTELDILVGTTAIQLFDEKNQSCEFWLGTNLQESECMILPYDEPLMKEPGYLKDSWEAKHTGHSFYNKQYSLEEKNRYFEYVFANNQARVPASVQDYILKASTHTCCLIIEENSALFADSWDGQLYNEDKITVLKRVAKVFEQAYIRFLDLQKAELNAREAQIETALERIRSSSMAMHQSSDLHGVIKIVTDQLCGLDIKFDVANFAKVDEEGNWDLWISTPEQSYPAQVFVPYLNHPIFNSVFESHKKGIPFYTDVYGLEDKNIFFNHFFENSDARHIPEARKQYVLKRSGFARSLFNCKNIWFVISNYDGIPFSEEKNAVFKRFANVFEQTYTRFMDLQKVEAQAREAQIEASLEKVRAKAMSMNETNDLSSTVLLAFSELKKLGLNPLRFGVGLIEKETHRAELYSAVTSTEGESLAVMGWIEFKGHPVFKQIYDSWIKCEDYFPVLKGEELTSYYNLLAKGLNLKQTAAFAKDEIHYGHFLSLPVSCLYAWTLEPFCEADRKIMKRFAAIIELTFKRYLELQASEINALEANRRASLDRVRAEIASMRNPSDLDRITPLIWNELKVLEVPFIRCGVFIMDDPKALIHTYLSTPEGQGIAAFDMPFNTPGNIAQVLNHWRNNQVYLDHWNEEDFKEFASNLVKLGVMPSSEHYLNTLPPGGFYLHFLPFIQGMLYVGDVIELNADQLKLIQSLAEAFSAAYARYEDFNKLEAAKIQVEQTLTDLKQTQSQLIQSEKMASLGQLTAGIAHEIQNPLNFVNNFSEVNTELIDEIKQAVQSGNNEEVLALAENVRQNLEKIHFHGKRADAIVKSMLQHSSSSDQAGRNKKELTDINMLADEYLRLAYHGLRAKDKSFNATLHTDFDKSIGMIEVVGQDIARAILNLITNAFYSVHEQTKRNLNAENSKGAQYAPTVSIITKKILNTIEIRVKDNGTGIPPNVLDKIFQPFFTTKPTGQGTGLGLSLAYDIVKANGGELKVLTEVGQGSEFIIQLPV